jgi:hypothetical protein
MLGVVILRINSVKEIEVVKMFVGANEFRNAVIFQRCCMNGIARFYALLPVLLEQINGEANIGIIDRQYGQRIIEKG